MKKIKKDVIIKETLIAKKDWSIVQNNEKYNIKKGDDVIKLGVPERFFVNLKTEKVI